MAVIVALVLFILLMTSVVLEGLKIEVRQQVDNAVKAGEEVHLHCPSKHSSGVLQVMWQKIVSEDEVTVATCLPSRHKLNPEFSGRIGLRGAGVQDCSLVVHNVTRQDEACYLCLIITRADVAYTEKTCLQIHELHGPVLNVTTSNSTGEVVVSCSATGCPAPNVTLHVPQKHRTQNSSVRNTNGTVTVVCTAEFQLKEAQECHCSVTSPFGHETVVQTIPAPGSLILIDTANQSDMDDGLYIGLASGCVLAFAVIAFVVIAIVFIAKKYQKSSFTKVENLKDNKNLEKEHIEKTPEWEKKSVSLRNRTPAKTEKENLCSTQLLTPRKLFHSQIV